MLREGCGVLLKKKPPPHNFFFSHTVAIKNSLKWPLSSWQSSFPLSRGTPPPDVLISGCVYAGQILGLMMANLSEVGTA